MGSATFVFIYFVIYSAYRKGIDASMKTAPQTFRIQIFCPNCVESPFWVFFKRNGDTRFKRWQQRGSLNITRNFNWIQFSFTNKNTKNWAWEIISAPDDKTKKTDTFKVLKKKKEKEELHQHHNHQKPLKIINFKKKIKIKKKKSVTNSLSLRRPLEVATTIAVCVYIFF